MKKEPGLPADRWATRRQTRGVRNNTTVPPPPILSESEHSSAYDVRQVIPHTPA